MRMSERTQVPKTVTPCPCAQWARADIGYPYHLRGRGGIPLVTNHHPQCEHYNDSLIPVWKVTVDELSTYCDNPIDAQETGGDEAVIEEQLMHREVFEHLPDFNGF
jgi:hypothetical protein